MTQDNLNPKPGFMFTTNHVLTGRELSDKDYVDLQHFLSKAFEMCGMTYAEAFDTIRTIFPKDHFREHLCRQWKAKEKEFGSWFLNIDWASRIKVYNYLGVADPDDDRYLKDISKDELGKLFATEPRMGKLITVVMIFFLNHGINEQCTPWLQLFRVPKKQGSSFDEKNPCFGNGVNWMKYLSKLAEADQRRILDLIIRYYNG